MEALPADTVSWMHCQDGGVGTLHAVFGGIDTGTGSLFVARFEIQGELVPGKVVPVNKCASAPFKGVEENSRVYEVLQCKGVVSWVPASNGGVPPRALVTGRTRTNESLYTCRAFYKNTITIGKVHPSHNTGYISFGGKEIKVSDYEVLVVKAF